MISRPERDGLEKRVNKSESDMVKRVLFIFFTFFLSAHLYAQTVADSTNFSVFYDSPKNFTLAGLEISGIRFLDTEVLKGLSGLNIGDVYKIPGDEITAALRKYWKQGLFSDVKISATKIIGDKIWLNVYLQERPRLAAKNYHGVSKSEKEDIEKQVMMLVGGQVTDNLVNTAQRQILAFYQGKGRIHDQPRDVKAAHIKVACNSMFAKSVPTPDAQFT